MNTVSNFIEKNNPSQDDRQRIEFLEKKVQTKDEVLAELMAEHLALKKVLGNSDRELGAA